MAKAKPSSPAKPKGKAPSKSPMAFKDRTSTIKSGDLESVVPTEDAPIRLQKKLAGY